MEFEPQPSEVEMIQHLKKKVEGGIAAISSLTIADYDVYGSEGPEEIFQRHVQREEENPNPEFKKQKEEEYMYLFTTVKKYPSGQTIRKTGKGSWEIQTLDVCEDQEKMLVGFKKTLSFQPSEKRKLESDHMWIMEEFFLFSNDDQFTTLCKIFKKKKERDMELAWVWEWCKASSSFYRCKKPHN